MQDNARSQSVYRSFDEDRSVLLPDTAPVPPQILARWAALASQRSFQGMLPRQGAQPA